VGEEEAGPSKRMVIAYPGLVLLMIYSLLINLFDIL